MIAPKLDETLIYAERYGLDSERLEYVRQLAKNGIEGDFSFQEMQNQIVSKYFGYYGSIGLSFL